MMKLLSPNGGQLDEETAFPDTEVGRIDKEKAVARTKEIQKHQSPEGSLGLPPLLDKRRLEFGVVDEHFDAQCIYDRIYVYQIGDQLSTYGKGSKIYRPDSVNVNERETANRGILIGAGLLALDHLHSNGIELGHIVRFVKLAVLREKGGYVAGHEESVLILRSGDIISSEDLRKNLRSGDTKASEYTDDSGNTRYCYVDRDGKQLRPQLGFMPADM